VSAIKVDGRALHARVRAGEDVVPPDRDVVAHTITLEDFDAERGVIRFRVACEKGFYVRSLGRDVARALGTVGHLTALRRTRSGTFDLARAASFDDLCKARDDDATRSALVARVLELRDAWTGPRVTVDEAGAEDARQGRRIAPGSIVSGEIVPPSEGETGEVVALFDTSGAILALAATDPEGHLRIARGFVPTS
jgi:tRNA pseudouridine55 synthase